MAESARKGSFPRKLPQGPQVPQSPVALGRTSFPDDTGLSPSSTPWAVGFPALTVCGGSGRSVASGTLEGRRNGGGHAGSAMQPSCGHRACLRRERISGCLLMADGIIKWNDRRKRGGILQESAQISEVMMSVLAV